MFIPEHQSPRKDAVVRLGIFRAGGESRGSRPHTLGEQCHEWKALALATLASGHYAPGHHALSEHCKVMDGKAGRLTKDGLPGCLST